jgi:hypothetical protein
MAGQQPEQNIAIRQAMHDAGIRSNEPVLLAGHSQGGIAAASMAADPATRADFDITNVYTGGAPIAHFNIPDNVNVLAIEHTQDAVPRLDGKPNPDRPTWITVQRDPTGLLNQHQQPITSTAATHDSYAYTDTAHLVDASSDPTIVKARNAFQPFFANASHATLSTYTLTRDLP